MVPDHGRQASKMLVVQEATLVETSKKLLQDMKEGGIILSCLATLCHSIKDLYP